MVYDVVKDSVRYAYVHSVLLMNKSGDLTTILEVRRVGKEKEVGKGRAGRDSLNVYWQDVIFQLISGLDEIGQRSFILAPTQYSFLSCFLICNSIF